MNTKISFYSFEHTQNPTTHNFRKHKQSHFKQFQNQRMQQNMSLIKIKRKKAVSQSVLVRSQQEKQLLSFLKVPNLPSIQLKKSKKRESSLGEYTNPQKKRKNSSPLQKILENQQKFMKTYFKRLKNFQRKEGIQVIRHKFDEVQVEDWTVKGYLKGDELILKAFHKSGRQRYLKYNYSKHKADINNNYVDFVKLKVELQLMGAYDN